MSPNAPESGVVRIIDANLNRAREALRVMEEHARFVLNDAGLTLTLKDLRHALAAATPEHLHHTLVTARDTPRDVGCDVTADGEYRRGSSADVAKAAGLRLTEALRTVEEYAKTIDATWAAVIERIRYSAYDVDRRLRMHAAATERFGLVRLYVLITESLCRGDWLATAEAVLRGGADALQLREKELPDRILVDRARTLAALCHEHGALLIVNDRPDIAAISGADGVHVGTDDVCVADARRVLSPDRIVGVSTHTGGQIKAAAATAPDYVAVGPMFPTPTKPREDVAGLPMLTRARELTSLPLVAIGGIDQDNGPGVVAAGGGCCLCVCRAVVEAPDPEAATSALREIITLADGAAEAGV